MSQWMGLAVICLAGWGIADIVMRCCRFVAMAMRKPMPVRTPHERFTLPQKPPTEVFVKHDRADAAEADANNAAWRKSDGE